MPKELTVKDVMTLRWMTLGECATDVQVDVEVVRQWCVAYENGDESGLPSSHFGAKAGDAADPKDRPKRLNRRVHVDDWEAFKGRRRKHERQQEREIERSFDRAPRQYPPRSELRARREVGAGQGQ